VARGFRTIPSESDEVLAKDRFSSSVSRASRPLANAGTADEVADGVVFFCAEGAALVTVETLLMDAGAHLDHMLTRVS
jgi:enoyl-[acyl-carrier-protein] reductase (NADH)